MLAFVPPLAKGATPVTSAVRETRELVTVWVLPAKWAIPTPGEEATTHVGQVTVFVDSDSGEENVAFIPVNVKFVHAHWLIFEVGAGNNMIWFAAGTAFGLSSITEVVMLVGANQPHELATLEGAVPCGIWSDPARPAVESIVTVES